MNLFHDDQQAWLSGHSEAPLDPQREIIDPHHHLWREIMGSAYNIDELAADTDSGHRIQGTLFMECNSAYRESGPEHEKPLGETEYVLAQAQRGRDEGIGAPLLGMVGHARLDDPETLDDVLDQHMALAGDFFKGIRHAGASARAGDAARLFIPGAAPPDLYAREAFRAGVRRLGQRGLSYDTWQYHYQLPDYIDLARACPDTLMVLDHLSTPLGVASFAGRHAEIFPRWQAAMRDLSECPNVYLKLGGLAMPDNGFGWHLADSPPDSDAVLKAQRHWYEHALDCFGAERCMFESNFPVDRLSLSYGVYWNAMKKLTADYSEAEKTALFSGTARKVYRL